MSGPMVVRRKPTKDVAIRWTGDNVDEVLTFLNSGPQPLWGADAEIGLGHVHVNTGHGIALASVGDWIVRGETGMFWPVESDAFDRTYEIIGSVAQIGGP